jgi:protein SCO1/2
MKYLSFGILLFAHVIFATPIADAQNSKSYTVRGLVEKIASDLHTITIHHQAIPDYMMEMTMDFSVKNTNELSGIASGDKITFKLVVSKNDEWVENIRRVGHSTQPVTNQMSMPMNMSQAMTLELKPGDVLPDYELTDENGKKIRISDFRGDTIAFTFFYSRCPLPDYCPRMNRNFSEARNLILADTNAPANWQLLCVSFDPAFDTPETLSNYANFYRGENTNHWLFAVASTNTLAGIAPRLDLMIMRDGENIMSHNLRTVVLGPQGRIFCQFDGNQWTPKELADAILQATERKNSSR